MFKGQGLGFKDPQRAHILRLLGPRTLLYKASGLFKGQGPEGFRD